MTENEKTLIYIPNNREYIEILGYRIDGFDSFEAFCEHLKKYAEMEDLINRQKAEIKRLREDIKAQDSSISSLLSIVNSNYQNGRNEAIKEFAERLKAVYTEDKRYDRPNAHTMLIILFAIIDNLVKEMTGEPKSPPHEICVVCGDQVPEGRQVCYMCETGQEFLNKKKE